MTVHPETDDRKDDTTIFFPKSITHDNIIRNNEKIEAFAILSNRAAEKKDTDTFNDLPAEAGRLLWA